jgi:hypothetical protein
MFLCVSFLVAATNSSNAQTLQNNESKVLSVEQLKGDFQLLRSKLESSQPGLYLYTSKDSLDKIFENIGSSLNEPITSLAFFRRIAPLNKILRNLHTRICASAAYEKATETGLPRFPLDIHWQDGKMYVLRNHSGNDSILSGFVIKSINGERAETIFQTLLDCSVRDGFNESYPLAQASRNFSFYYAQLIATPQTFHLELALPDGSSKYIDLPGITGTEIRNSRTEKYNGRYSQYSEDYDAWITNKEPALRFETRRDVGILTLRTFHIYTIEGSGQKYEEFFKQSFGQLLANSTKHLIIDLRNNHGGHDLLGMSLMSYLHDSVFYYYKKRSAFVKPIGKSVKKENTYEIVGRRGWIGKVTPAKEIYKGRVYVLMNGYSVSAAGEFIGHLKNINRAIFIGEEAGGNPAIFTGGQSLPIDLPHTRITGTIPLNLVEMNVTIKNTGHGVIPDYEIKPGIKDVLESKDVEMDFAMELIRRGEWQLIKQ